MGTLVGLGESLDLRGLVERGEDVGLRRRGCFCDQVCCCAGGGGGFCEG